MFDIIAYPIGYILKLIYNTLAFHNYGIAIILLTIVIKALLLPLTVKQSRSMAKISEIQPRLQELQKKYANEPEKLNAETMKLYQEEKINPAGGCLPLLIQMPIILSLYYVISQPLKYMYGVSANVIQQLYGMIPAGADKLTNLRDLSIINYFTKNPDRLSDVSGLITQDHLLNMSFFGLQLGATPSLSFGRLFGAAPDMQAWLLLLIPVLAVLTTYASVRYSMQQNPQPASDKAQNSMQNSMMLMSPIMTGFISFTVPAGLGLYWIISNLLQILQQMYMNKFIIKKGTLSRTAESMKLNS